jgi:hypothetical protein
MIGITDLSVDPHIVENKATGTLSSCKDAISDVDGKSIQERPPQESPPLFLHFIDLNSMILTSVCDSISI